MSTQTTNLQLTLPDDSDYIRLSDFTDNFNKLDEMGIDYIIENNFNNEQSWSYRKWKSGVIEAWKTVTKTVTDKGEQKIDGSYPNNMTFSEAPTITVTANQELSGPAYVGFVRATTSSYDIRIQNINRTDNPLNVRLYIIGKIATS